MLSAAACVVAAFVTFTPSALAPFEDALQPRGIAPHKQAAAQPQEAAPLPQRSATPPLDTAAPRVERAPVFGIEAARRLLASLDLTQRQAAMLPFDSPDRLRWRRDPSPRPGAAVREMTDVQQRHLDVLLATVLSDAGIAAVEGVRREQDTIGRSEEGLGHGYYWLAVYGEPGRGAWGWRFGGHHVSIHVTYDGDRLTSALPLMLGGQQCGAGDADCPGYVALRDREIVARRIAASCEAESWKLAHIAEYAGSALALSEPRPQPLGKSEGGVPLARLDARQRSDADALILQYLGVLHSSISEELARKFADAAKVRFSWGGLREPGRAHYYRFLAPELLIEYASSGEHMHTLIRTDESVP